MRRRLWPILWAAWAILFAILETIAIRRKNPGDTLSENIRSLFHTKRPVGRLVFIATWLGFTAWFLPHIAKH